MKLNKVLLIFLFFVSFVVFAGWQLLQSEFFGQRVSRVLTQYTQDELRTQISFKDIEFTFFPPGLVISNVAFKNDKLEGFVQKLGIEFDIVKSMQRRLTIDEIYIHSSNIKLNNNEKEDSKLELPKISELIDGLNKFVPLKLNKLSVVKSKVLKSKSSVFIENLELRPEIESVAVRARIGSVSNSRYDKYLSKLSLDGDFKLNDEKISITDLSIKDENLNINVNGDLSNYKKIQSIDGDLNIKFAGKVKGLHDYLDIAKVGYLEKGELNLISKLKFSKENFVANNNLKIKNLISSFVDLSSGELDFVIDKNKINFLSAQLSKGAQRLELLEAFEFFNFKSKKFIEEDIKVRLNQFQLKNGLKFLKKNLSILNSKVSGDLDFMLNEKDFHFVLAKGAQLEETSLLINGKKGLNIPFLKLTDAKFSVYPNSFKMNATVSAEALSTSIDGLVTKNQIRFSTSNGAVNLEKLGPIFGFDIKGEGDLKLDVVKNKEDSSLFIDSKLVNFNLLGFKQKKVDAKLQIDFDKRMLSIRDLVGDHGLTKTKANLELNLDDLSLDGDISHSAINYGEFLDIYEPILYGLKDKNFNFSGNWNTKFKVSGKANINDLVVSGNFNGKESYIFDEVFDSVNFKYVYADQKVEFQDLLALKGKGSLSGEIKLDIAKGKNNLLFAIKDLPVISINNMKKLPFSFNGKLDGDFKLMYSDKVDYINSRLKISNSFLRERRLGDSTLELLGSDKKFNVFLSVLGGKVKVDSENFLKSKSMSETKINIALDDINELLGANKFVDTSEANIEGDLYASGGIKYNFSKRQMYDAVLSLKKVRLVKNNIDLNFFNGGSEQILISNGVIKKWDLYARGRNIHLISKGDGNTLKEFNINTDFRIDASILETFNKLVSKSSGALIGNLKFFQNFGENDYDLKLKARNINLSVNDSPFRLTNTEFLITARDEKVNLERLNSQMNSGKVSGKGYVDFSSVIPDVNFDFKADHAGFNFLDRSSASFSGSASLVGKGFPYRLDSNIVLERVEILNEFVDFTSKKGISGDIKYLPEDQLGLSSDIVTFSSFISTASPIKIRNSMADIFMDGKIYLKGTENRLLGDGQLNLSPRSNKIFFKSNTYELNKADVQFDYNRSLLNPIVDVEASTSISDYNLSAKVKGPVNSFDLILNSTPSLSQNDILSLIAFGYTEDISNDLTDSQRSSMTQAGIGALLFDQFKINDTLKKELGVRVNVATEITNERTNFLSQRSGVGAVGARVTSATKIEVKKDLTEKVELAVSSTVGNTAGQRQSMNLNYSLSDKLSLEGIYESRTDAEASGQVQGSSVGVDMKFKWSFD